MTISFQKQGNHYYGTLCTVTRDGKKVTKEYGEQLGRVIDRERLVFFSRKRGLYRYDPNTGEFLPPPDDVEVPQRKSRLKVPSRPITFGFGDVYLLDQFIKRSGLYKILNDAYTDKLDSLKAMICFYIVSSLSNCYASDWFSTSYAKYLFPKARISSSQISELLKYIGDPARQQTFFFSYIRWFAQTFQKEDLGNILIDSTGLPNNIHFSLTAISNHNGEINNEVRLIYVVQQSTGMPIYLRCIPGNIIDVNTIKRTIIELNHLGVDTHHAITDAGYFSEENMETFYSNKISYLIRLQPNRCLYKSIVTRYLPDIKKNGVLVQQGNRLVRVQKVPCQVNEKRNQNNEIIEQGYPAYAYLCVDEQRSALEQLNLIDKVAQGKLSIDQYVQQLEKKGVFVLVSKRSIDPKKVLAIYYTRQEIEQVFDLGKNYASMLPLSVQTEESFRGHLVLTFIATILVKMISEKLKVTKYPITPTFANLATQSCTKFGLEFVTSEPNKITRKAYEAVGIDYPTTVCIE